MQFLALPPILPAVSAVAEDPVLPVVSAVAEAPVLPVVSAVVEAPVLPVVSAVAEPPIMPGAQLVVADSSDPLAKIRSLLEDGAMFKQDAGSNIPHGNPTWARDTACARKGNERWKQMCAALEDEYSKLVGDLIPGYVLPWHLKVCSRWTHRGKATKVLFIQLMVAELQGIAEIERFASPAEGLCGVDKVFVRAEDVAKFQNMPIPIPQRGFDKKHRKTVNSIWNRAGFDVARKCTRNKAEYIVLCFEAAILAKHQDFYLKAHSPKKPSVVEEACASPA